MNAKSAPIHPLVSVEWLKERFDAPDIKIVDATWIAPFIDPDTKGRDLYNKGHIPGAVFFDIDEIADTSSDLPHMLPDPVKFSSMVRKMGLGDGHRIVVYDQNNMMAAPRAWWTFRVMGHEDVVVLNGGMNAWRQSGGPEQDLPPHLINERHYTSMKNDLLVANLDEMKTYVEGAVRQIIDARPEGRFKGTAPEPRAGLKGGAMPGAISLPHAQLMTSDGAMKPEADLKAAFEAAGVDLSQPIVTTCGSGVTASVLALGLAAIGRSDVAVYDGSWSEWGAQDDCPVVAG